MRFILFTILLFTIQLIHANDQLEISILTCSPGEEVYSVFGHSSIRVINKTRGTDEVYNFGIFDFDTPNFAYKFLKGKLQYQLGIQQTPNFIDIYSSENRLVSEQILDLTDEQKLIISERLKHLYQPENRFYYYSFLNRNCSTELRDLLSIAGANFSVDTLNQSNRQLINPYLKHIPWLRLGVNMLMGKTMDIKSNRNQNMFLPDYLRNEVDAASMDQGQLVNYEQNLNSIPSEKPLSIQKILAPTLIFSVLFFLLLFRFPKAVKFFFCFSIGFTGILLAALWLFSSHPEIRNNLNLLWCNPLYLLYIPLLVRNKQSKALTYTLSGGLILTVIIWLSGIQQFDIAVLPLLLSLALMNYQGLQKTKQPSAITH